MMATLKVKKTHAARSTQNPALEWEDVSIKSPKKGATKMHLEEYNFASPILATPAKRTECPHEHSRMVGSDPRMFTRFPYRASLMTLLRRVETKPTDSAAYAWTAKDEPVVYAGYQNHWSPVLNVPVLTLVGTCNTILQPPMVTRDTHEYANVTVMASTSQQQQMVKFKVPLIQLIEQAKKRIVLEVAAAVDLDDHLVTYIIHAGEEPLAMIKLWNLSAHGCRKLHLHSVYQAPRAKVTDELHILGLSGVRTTTFQVSFPYIRSPLMEMLEELDLQAIGFRTKRDSRPRFTREDYEILPNPVDRNLLTRMTPQRSPYRHPSNHKYVVIPSRQTYFKGATPVKPFFYPPPIKHKPGMPFGNIKPVLFPAGFQTFRDLALDDTITVKEIAQDLAFNNGTDFLTDGIRMLAVSYHHDSSIIKKNLMMQFQQFHKKYQPLNQSKPLPYIVRPTIDQVMPEDWYHSTKHPSVSSNDDKIRIIEEGQDIPYYQDDVSSAASLSDIDFDLVSPSVIDESFWFPADHPINHLEDGSQTVKEPQRTPADKSMNVKTPAFSRKEMRFHEMMESLSPKPPPTKQVKRNHAISNSRNENDANANEAHIPVFLQLPEGTEMLPAYTLEAPIATQSNEAEPVVESNCERNQNSAAKMKMIKETAIKSIIRADKEIIDCIQNLTQHGVTVTEVTSEINNNEAQN